MDNTLLSQWIFSASVATLPGLYDGMGYLSAAVAQAECEPKHGKAHLDNRPMKLHFRLNYNTIWGERLHVGITYKGRDGSERSYDLPMNTDDGQLWTLETTAIESRQCAMESFTYIYKVKDADGNEVRSEWGLCQERWPSTQQKTTFCLTVGATFHCKAISTPTHILQPSTRPSTRKPKPCGCHCSGAPSCFACRLATVARPVVGRVRKPSGHRRLERVALSAHAICRETAVDAFDKRGRNNGLPVGIQVCGG